MMGMRFKEFVSTLENNQGWDPDFLSLDFGIDNVFNEEYCFPDEKEEVIDKFNKRVKHIYDTTRSVNNVTALHMAVALNQKKVVQRLIDQGADTSIECSFHKREYQTTLGKKKTEFWAPVDYNSSRRQVEHTCTNYTPLGLAEELGHDCIEVLSKFSKFCSAKSLVSAA